MDRPGSPTVRQHEDGRGGLAGLALPGFILVSLMHLESVLHVLQHPAPVEQAVALQAITSKLDSFHCQAGVFGEGVGHLTDKGGDFFKHTEAFLFAQAAWSLAGGFLTQNKPTRGDGDQGARAYFQCGINK